MSVRRVAVGGALTGAALAIMTSLLGWSYANMQLAGPIGTILGGLAFTALPDRIGSQRYRSPLDTAGSSRAVAHSRGFVRHSQPTAAAVLRRARFGEAWSRDVTSAGGFSTTLHLPDPFLATRSQQPGARPTLRDGLSPKQKRSLALPSLRMMRRILVTGMSGTGKSSALERLQRLGFRTVDTDEGDWTEWSEAEGGYVWREERMAAVLGDDAGPSLYVSGTVSNQGRFYDRFDAIVLLSAPANVLLSRIDARTTNRYGKTAGQRELVLRDLAEAEPLIRRTCTHEIDTTQPLADVVKQLAELGRDPSA